MRLAGCKKEIYVEKILQVLVEPKRTFIYFYLEVLFSNKQVILVFYSSVITKHLLNSCKLSYRQSSMFQNSSVSQQQCFSFSPNISLFHKAFPNFAA
jgi:hypothetical protein